MAGNSSQRAVLLALIGNAFLTVVKFVTFAFSGSGAMFSEAMHTLADTSNQALLFIGIRRSHKPADAMFHYGFGGERFLFALLSAVGIFVLGCGVTLYHGVHTLSHPPELAFDWSLFAVLGVALLVDGWVLLQAVKAVHEVRGDRSLREFLRTTSDPTIAAVLLEDSVACLGVLIAAAGIALSWSTGSHIPDAVATLLIGLMMGAIAIWLGYKNRSLILGRALPDDVQREIVAYLAEQPTIERVHAIKSRIVGAERFKFGAEVDWNGAVLAEGLGAFVESRRDELGNETGRQGFARDFGERLTEALGDEIDRIEAELRERFPQLAFVDLESD